MIIGGDKSEEAPTENTGTRDDEAPTNSAGTYSSDDSGSMTFEVDD